MLVIADARAPRPSAGVMGGRDSEIGAGTTRMALESACFHPASVRRDQQAARAEDRGVDPIRARRPTSTRAPAGIARAAALLQQIGAGRPVGRLIDRYPAPRPAAVVTRCAPRASRGCSAWTCRPDDVDADPRRRSASASNGRSASADALDRHRADVPRGRVARDRSDRGGRPALRLRPACRRPSRR